MGDESKKKAKNTILSETVGNDDFARHAFGTNPQWLDGGKSSEVSFDLQHTRADGSAILGGAGWNIYGPHIARYAMRMPGGAVTYASVVDLREREPLGVFEAHVGKATSTDAGAHARWRTYGEAVVDYNDTTLTPILQNAVHSVMNGRNVSKEYRLSTSTEGLNAGLVGASEFQVRRPIAGGIEARASAFVAGEAGTDRLAASAGVRLVVGHRLDGLPSPIATANPEATPRNWVTMPEMGKRGAWSLGVEAEQYIIGANRFLAGGEQENATPWRAAVTAALGISRTVTAAVGVEAVQNPIAPRNAYERRGPDANYLAKASVSVRF